jgi:ABC-type multidrug transport system fused ATPase/permease subunit
MIEKFKKLANFKAYYWLAGYIRYHRSSFIVVILISTLSPLLSILSVLASKQVIDLSIQKNIQKALVYMLFFAGLMFSQMLLSAYSNWKTSNLKESLNNHVQKNFLELLYRIEWPYLNKYHSGDILTRLTSDVSSIVDGMVTLVPTMIALCVQLLTAFCVLFYLDHTLALLAFVLGPVSVIFAWFIGRKLKKMQHEIQASESIYRSFVHESIQNVLIIKIFENVQTNLKRVQFLQQTKFDLIMKRVRFGISTNLVLGFSYRIGFFMAFGRGAWNLSRGTSSFGTFTAFLQLVGQVQAPFEGLSRTLPQLVSTLASAERLMEFEELPLEKIVPHPDFHGGEALGLSLGNISFSYKENQPVLTDLSFKINPGEIVAIIGPSGEGKTTVIRLLLALLLAETGTLDLQDRYGQQLAVSATTRSYFSYVPQGNTLFSSSIADNLRIGCPGASDEDLIAAAKAACAWPFIETLPEGIHTIIGENGLGLSEGQAQRLSIARALLKPASILLLDEATSSLDSETEKTVLDNIRNLSPRRTCIAITHRQTVFEICDRIYRLKQGSLYEEKKAD